MNIVPFLGNAFLHAYNARRANFMGSPIFNFSFTEGNTINYDGARYDVPDQLTVSGISKQIQNQSTISLKDENDYDTTFSAEIKGDFTGVFFSGSAYSNLTFRGSLFTSNEVEYALNTLVYQTYTAQRNTYANCLNTNFQQDLNHLPADMTDNFQAFIDFFDLYGTHFLYNGNFGATIYMQTTTEKSLRKTLSEQEIKAGITAGFNGAVSSGNLSADTVYNNSATLSKNRSSFSFYFESFGGTLTQDLTKFEASVSAQPVLLLTSYAALSPAQFKPISLLCSDGNKRKLINKAIESYLLLAQAEDGLISKPHYFVPDVSFKALSDGFVISSLCESRSPTQSQVFITIADQTCAASIHYSPPIKAYIPASMAAVAVKSNTSYHFASQTGTPKTAFLSVAVQNNSVFGEPKKVTVNQVNQAETNGFLFANLSGATDGVRGNISVAIGASNAQLSEVGGCAVYVNSSNLQIPDNNFCYPLLKGQFFKITESFRGTITTEYQFITIDQVMSSLGTATPRSLGIEYTAVNDGFLVACVSASDGSFGTLSTVLNAAITEDMSTIGVAVFNQSDILDISLPLSSAFIPVPKGATYKIGFDKNLPFSGNPASKIYWFDFFPATQQYDLSSICEQEQKLIAWQSDAIRFDRPIEFEE